MGIQREVHVRLNWFADNGIFYSFNMCKQFLVSATFVLLFTLKATTQHFQLNGSPIFRTILESWGISFPILWHICVEFHMYVSMALKYHYVDGMDPWMAPIPIVMFC